MIVLEVRNLDVRGDVGLLGDMKHGYGNDVRLYFEVTWRKRAIRAR